MNAPPLPFPTVVAWDGRRVRLLDQTRLPEHEAYLDCSRLEELCAAIQRLVVRGAPAIGCAAGYGVLLALDEAVSERPAAWREGFERRCHLLAEARPTAVNLRWAVERCLAVARRAGPQAGAPQVRAALEAEALRIHEEDRRMCEAIGRHGAALLPRPQATLLTHCNAGALATGGSGTALAVMYAAQAAGVRLKVFADETRPLLQGARLTAWELSRAGIAVTVICDNMAAWVLKTRAVDAVITGADRIAANGDAANKIGTYGLAILARHHGIPFYVAAPSSTFDLSLPDGTGIPIEERGRAEVAEPYGRVSAPAAAGVFNPAFDVTPAELIDALITERGVLRPPYGPAIAGSLGRSGPGESRS